MKPLIFAENKMAERYGKWINKGLIGKGGQAQTFRVIEEGAEEKGEFVLKRLNSSRLKRGKTEVTACLRLSHSNVVQIIDHDLESAKPYLVVEYCRGGDLKKADISHLSLLDRLKMFAAICQGVCHAHSQGIIHRDLKPANIFLREDGVTPVVGDFGICFIVNEESERQTSDTEVAAPRWFGAPELEDGRAEDIGPQADVYSLGKILYWLISEGREKRFFAREKHRDPAYDLTQDSKDPAVYMLYELLDKAIVFSPENRLPSAIEVANEMGKIIQRIERQGHITNVTVPQHCSYCGVGFYKVEIDTLNSPTPDPSNAMGNIGFYYSPQSQDTEVLILVCDYCANVQTFRPRLSANRNAWRKPDNR